MAPGGERHLSLDRRPKRRFDDHLLRCNLRVPRSIAKDASPRRRLQSTLRAHTQYGRYGNRLAADDPLANEGSSTDVRHRTDCPRHVAIGETPPRAPGIARDSSAIELVAPMTWRSKGE